MELLITGPADDPRDPRTLAHMSSVTALYDLHEAISLWAIVYPTPERRSSNNSTDDNEDTDAPLSRRFIDALCWLMDYDIGGSSVVSIVIEELLGSVRYWVASSGKTKIKALNNLREILRQIKDVSALSLPEKMRLETKLTTEAVNFSFQRYKNYAKWLWRSLELANTEVAELEPLSRELMGNRPRQDQPTPHTAAAAVTQELLKLRRDAEGDHVKFCDFAYFFPNTEAMASLNLLCDDTSVSTNWRSVRHHIGRLGTWRKAAKNLVYIAAEVPALVHGYSVETLDQYADDLLAASPEIIGAALGTRSPGSRSEPINRALTLLNNMGRGDVEAEFNKRMEQFPSARMHPECIAAEYSHDMRLAFFGGDRYIGSSKLSCYCCSLYLTQHRGQFVTRPCHENVWAKWLPPVILKGDNEAQHMLAHELLQQMIQKIQSDISIQIIRQRQWRGRSPESATSISARSVFFRR